MIPFYHTSQVAQWIKNLTAKAGDAGLIPGSGRSLGKGTSNPLQYSCLKNPKDRIPWWASIQKGHKDSDMTEWLSTSMNYLDWCLFSRLTSWETQAGTLSCWSFQRWHCLVVKRYRECWWEREVKMQWKSMRWFSDQEALEVIMCGVVDMDIKLILYVADGGIEMTVNWLPRLS